MYISKYSLSLKNRSYVFHFLTVLTKSLQIHTPIPSIKRGQRGVFVVHASHELFLIIPSHIIHTSPSRGKGLRKLIYTRNL